MQTLGSGSLDGQESWQVYPPSDHRVLGHLMYLQLTQVRDLMEIIN
jgi:hypothetical protein